MIINTVFNRCSVFNLSGGFNTFGKINRSLVARTAMIIAFSIFLSKNISAQLATLDSKKIMATMPVFKKIDTLVQEETLKYTTEYRSRMTAAQKWSDSLNSISRKSPYFTEVLDKTQKAEYDLKQYEQQVLKKIEEYKSIILSPYYEKINKAIKLVALRMKYMQVLDVQTTNFLYIDNSADITQEVIKELSN